MRKIPLWGIVSWLAGASGALSAYLLSIDGFEQWDWFSVITGFVGLVATGLASLAAHLHKVGKEVPSQFPEWHDDGNWLHGIELSAAPLRRNSGFQFSKRSLGNREQLDPFMQRVVTRGLAYSPYDFIITNAFRTDAEQIEHVKNGTSKTLDSRHVEDPAQAFDILVLNEKGEVTHEEKYYKAAATAIREAAADEGGSITSGALDWGWDIYHFERSRSEVPYTREPIKIDIEV